MAERAFGRAHVERKKAAKAARKNAHLRQRGQTWENALVALTSLGFNERDALAVLT